MSTSDVKKALGGVNPPDLMVFGNVSKTTGAAGFPLQIDICTWQEGVSTPLASFQVEVETASSASDADKEYQALLNDIIVNTAPTSTPVPVSSLGSKAALTPLWIIAEKGNEVLSVTFGSQAQPPDPKVLTDIARMASAHLGW